MPEAQIPSLGQEDALEKETEIHSSILAWEIPWIEELGVGATVYGISEVSETT